MQHERHAALGQKTPQGFMGRVVDVAFAADVGEHLKAHETEFVHAALEFAAGRVHIAETERSHPPEALRVKRRRLGEAVVADSREFVRVFRVFGEVRAWNVDAD